MMISENNYRIFFSDLRSKYIPSDTEQVAKQILKKYEIENGPIKKDDIKKKISFYIEELFNLQKKEFKSVFEKTVNSWFDFLIENPKKYKQIRNFLGSEFLNKNSKNLTISQVLNKTGIITKNLVISNNQSAKNRAGKGFEQYFKLLCQRLNIKIDYQKEIDEQEQLDFAFPNIESLNDNPSNSIVGEFQTTLADRFRLSLGKLSETKFNKVTKAICTLSGDDLVSPKGVKDLTNPKIQELKNKGWILVLRNKIKIAKFSNDKEIYSFEQFIEKLL